MKKLQFFTLLVLSLSIFACSDDEGNNNANPEGLVGTWLVTSATCNDGVSTTNFEGEEIARAEFTYFWDNIDNVELVFNANNTLESSGNYTQVLTTTTFAQGMNFGTETTNTPVDYSSTGTYVATANTLTVTSTGGQINGDSSAATGSSGEYQIISLDNNDMELRLNVDFTQTTQGVLLQNSQTLDITLAKM